MWLHVALDRHTMCEKLFHLMGLRCLCLQSKAESEDHLPGHASVVTLRRGLLIVPLMTPCLGLLATAELQRDHLNQDEAITSPGWGTWTLQRTSPTKRMAHLSLWGQCSRRSQDSWGFNVGHFLFVLRPFPSVLHCGELHFLFPVVSSAVALSLVSASVPIKSN